MKQFFLASALIAAAVGLFAVGDIYWPRPAPVAALGDLSGMQAIVTDVQGLASSGDLAGAKDRIRDLETAWDDAEPTLRPVNPEAWGHVDDAADGVLSALRAATPDAEAVKLALSDLTAALSDPSGGPVATGGPVMIGTIAVTDANGHALPCEAMLADVTQAGSARPPTGDKAAKVADLITRATERCNADDDTRADAFSAAALTELATN